MHFSATNRLGISKLGIFKLDFAVCTLTNKMKTKSRIVFIDCNTCISDSPFLF